MREPFHRLSRADIGLLGLAQVRERCWHPGVPAQRARRTGPAPQHDERALSSQRASRHEPLNFYVGGLVTTVVINSGVIAICAASSPFPSIANRLVDRSFHIGGSSQTEHAPEFLYGRFDRGDHPGSPHHAGRHQDHSPLARNLAAEAQQRLQGHQGSRRPAEQPIRRRSLLY